MTEIAIELDDETAKRLSEASEKDGISPSAWVKRAIRTQLAEKLPDSFFAVLGTWEDHRSAEEILRDIREEAPQAQRTALK
jgi:predicted transcriptional regulator